VSFWRNDVGRDLSARAAHLLAKTYAPLEWVWIVGDSQDTTYEALDGLLADHPRGDLVTLLDIGVQPVPQRAVDPRMWQFSRAAQAGLNAVPSDAEHVLIHESDIESPPDVVECLLAVEGDVVGAWPVLGDRHVFYDTWAYRGLDGDHFTNEWPYHIDAHERHPFEVSSVGTVWRFPAAALRQGLTCTEMGAVELCRGLRAQGYRIWCDPRLVVVQPRSTFVPQPFPVEA
jgi:hypothetical protein